MLDASAAVAGLVSDGPARRMMADQQLHCPHLVDSEVAQALRRLVAAGHVAPNDGRAALHGWARLAVVRYLAHGLLGRVWELRENLSAYDATYVALAEGLGCSLLTADARLSRAPGLQCPVTVLPG